jgi:hypothetical protein
MENTKWQDISTMVPFVIEYFEKWKNKFLNDPRILVNQTEAEELAGGRMNLKYLKDRDLIFPYQFGIETVTDRDGNVITEPKGRIYYKQHDIIKAIEDGNILKCLQNRK